MKDNGSLRVVRQALEWYASPRTWNQWLPQSAGEHARHALKALDEVELTLRRNAQLLEGSVGASLRGDKKA